jgi:peptidyl-prolyl cis-trans isomerase A (cyclophilin A)
MKEVKQSMLGIQLLVTGMMMLGCQGKTFDPTWLKDKAPEAYTIRFETTKGKFDVRIHRAWSPQAADRLFQMVDHEYFDYAIFYRVTEDFVAQFGSSNRLLKEQWMASPIPDELVTQRNLRGRMSWARAGVNNRGSDLFINLADNPKLDTVEYLGVRGYPPLGEVIDGMEVVDKLYDIYGEDLMPEMDRMYTDRNGFMQMYPGLDYVKKAYLISKD